MSLQTTSNIIMIRPAAFGFNAETATSNTFQHVPALGKNEVQFLALAEFDRLVELLRSEGVDVEVVEDTQIPHTPDAIFPNNWISFHSNGTIVTYPMASVMRRQERREDLIQRLGKEFNIRHRIGLENHENKHQYLEGTGSMVLDRVNKIAYACISPRTDEEVLNEWCRIMSYSPFTFRAQFHGQDIYHTNVMMAIGDGVTVICLDVVEQEKRNVLYDHLASFGRDVVLLSSQQVDSFAGNMLAVRNKAGEQLMVMSKAAHQSLDQEQLDVIQRHARIISSDVHTIEEVGGGSVRCMIAENFLPHI